jgi:hypothetical protein
MEARKGDFNLETCRPRELWSDRHPVAAILVWMGENIYLVFSFIVPKMEMKRLIV